MGSTQLSNGFCIPQKEFWEGICNTQVRFPRTNRLPFRSQETTQCSIIKGRNKCIKIDLVCSFDARQTIKNLKKEKNYRSLKREIALAQYFSNVIFAPLTKEYWEPRVKFFFSPIKNTEMEKYSDLMQKSCLLGTTRIVIQVLQSCAVISYDLFSQTGTTFLIRKEIRNNNTKCNADVLCNNNI